MKRALLLIPFLLLAGCLPPAPPADDGGYLLDGFVPHGTWIVRVVPGVQVDVASAVSELVSISGLDLRMGPPANVWEPLASNEIRVQNGDCPVIPGALGCYYNFVIYLTGYESEPGGIRHELGHAVGLRHYNDSFHGSLQLMNAQEVGVTDYQDGDRNGLRAIGRAA